MRPAVDLASGAFMNILNFNIILLDFVQCNANYVRYVYLNDNEIVSGAMAAAMGFVYDMSELKVHTRTFSEVRVLSTAIRNIIEICAI